MASNDPPRDTGNDPVTVHVVPGNPTGDDNQPGGSEPVRSSQFLGRYKVLNQIGRGGFGQVFLAYDPELLRKVVIKVPRPDRKLNDDAVKRFLDEGKRLAKAEHPMIVGVHDMGMDDRNRPYVVMQYVEGKTLDELLRKREFSSSRILEILLEMGQALGEAHKFGVVHRDFRPANVIIDANGKLHLVNFSMSLHDELTIHEIHKRNPTGSPQFMAPEQVRGENHRADFRTDIWAFGVTMYLMLTETLPFTGRTRSAISDAIRYSNPSPLVELKPQLSAGLSAICIRCLSKLMEERYPSMAVLNQDLRPAVSSYQESRSSFNSDSVTYDPSQPQSYDDSETSAELSVQGTMTDGKIRHNKSWRTDSASRDSANVATWVVPKGLAPFDDDDSNYFTTLLPGPKDSLGTPEILRFWTSRLRYNRPVDSVAIGAIYGPAGCGKTSFVRAGLIPHLTKQVVPILIDCAVDCSPKSDLSSTLTEKLKLLGIENDGDNLQTGIRKIRQGQYPGHSDKKILLILDQFEFWLARRTDFLATELGDALRHCQSDSIQCLFVVRDEFWQSLSQFMNALDYRIEEKRNATQLPLPNHHHASRVLKAYCHSLGIFQFNKPVSKSQSRFIEESIQTVAQDNKILWYRLSLLSEFLKQLAPSWDRAPAPFGFQEIVKQFLVQHFERGPRAKVAGFTEHCRHLLKQLLPENCIHDSGILSRQEIQARVSDSMNQSGTVDFDESLLGDAISFLLFDLKLIAISQASSDSAGKPRLRLTFDFMAEPIRKWSNPESDRSLARLVQSNQVRRDFVTGLLVGIGITFLVLLSLIFAFFY